MASLGFVLLVFSFVLAVIAALLSPVAWGALRVHFGWAAFACYIASKIFGGGH
jgi:hypothetical protein